MTGLYMKAARKISLFLSGCRTATLVRLLPHVAGALLAASCAGMKDEEIVLERQLVLEGWIDSGGHPMVLLSDDIPLADGIIDASDLIDGIAKWAKVTVDDGDTTVVLTGRPDDRYFPPYVFTSSKMVGVPGKTYEVRAQYKGHVATARTTIPEPMALDTLYSAHISDDKYMVVCGFTAPPDKGHYFKFMTMIEGTDGRYHDTALGTMSDEVFDGYVEAHLFSTRRLFSFPYMNDICEGDTVWVKFCTIDEVSYKFWSNFEVNMFGDIVSMYQFETDMSANVEGALGYWTGYGAREYKLKIEPSPSQGADVLSGSGS